MNKELKQYRDPLLSVNADPIGFYEREFFVFSNFSSFAVEWHGHIWPTSEHAYQAAHFFETAPELVEQIAAARSAHDAYKIALPQAVALLESGSAVVLSIAGSEIHDATNRYRAVALNQYLQSRPQQVNLGEPGYDTLLGPGWWPLEDKFRWMSKSASVRLGAPAKGVRKKLEVRGFCPESVASRGPVTLTLRVSGSAQAASKTLNEVGAFLISMDALGTGEEWLTVELSVDRATNLPGDRRQLGLIFGTVLLKQ